MRSQLRNILLASLMAALTAIGAQIRLPMLSVPVTLQTLFVLLSGSLLGPYWGGVSMVIYLLLGLIGLPVFASGSGLAVLLSPSFGYLFAFPITAVWVGKRIFSLTEQTIPEKRMLFWRVWLNQFAGLFWIYFFGVLYLWLIKNIYTGEDFHLAHALLIGFVFFIPGEIAKSLLSAWLTIRVRQRLYFFVLQK